MEITPDEMNSAAKKQKPMFEVAPRGTYWAVNTKLQFQTFSGGTRKLNVTAHLLKAVTGGRHAEDFVGKKAYLTFWWNFESDWNKDKLAALCHAVYCKDKFSTD